MVHLEAPMQSSELNQYVKNYLLSHGCRMGERARQDCVYRVNHFLRLVAEGELNVQTIEQYRSDALRKGYSPATIESCVATVRFIAEYSGTKIPIGRSLTVPRPDPDVPTMNRIAELYNAVQCAQWPVELTGAKRANWWRGFIFLASWSALRLGDLRRLDWSAIKQDAVHVKASKTKRHGRAALRIPIIPPVRRHLEILRALRYPTVLGLTSCYTQLRRELKRIAREAGVAAVLPHGFRRYAITQWSKADAMAGRIIQGCGLGVMNHYLDVEGYLQRFAPKVEIPQAFLSAKEQLAIERNENVILARYRAATPSDKHLIDQLLDRIG